MTVTIALGADGGFDLTVPSILEGRTHVVHVPASSAGLSIIRKVLSERAKSERAKLGEAASPLQAQVEAWLRTEKLQRAAERDAASAATEAKHAHAAAKVLNGINLGELDL